MRFLVDESTGASVASYLRSEGHDVLAVVETMPEADDSAILARAATEERVVVTNDKDFGNLIYRELREHRGVILLRLREDSAHNRVRLVQLLLENYADRLEGSFTVATEETVRIRPMLRVL